MLIYSSSSSLLVMLITLLAVSSYAHVNKGSVYVSNTLYMLCLSSITGCSYMSGALQNNLETQFKEVRVALTVKHAHLKTPHVSRVPCILQAVLVTL